MSFANAKKGTVLKERQVFVELKPTRVYQDTFCHIISVKFVPKKLQGSEGTCPIIEKQFFAAILRGHEFF